MFETIMIVLGAILVLIGIVFALRLSKRIESSESGYDRDALKAGRWVWRGVALLGAFFVILFGALGLFYQVGQGEAKVIMNIDGTVAGEKATPGIAVKAPWQYTVDFDLFSQEVLYAGHGDETPSYSGGTVSGKEVTVAVGGVNGGSTQANLDISITYSVDGEQVTPIYKKYKSQERFTKQVVEKTILSTIRQIPAGYSAIEFRGEKRQEASDKILKTLNQKLEDKGITVDFVNLQDIRYSKTVEKALQEVENANQAVQKAEADQRQKLVEAETAKITAEGQAQAAIAKASGEAEANRLLAASLTPEVLAQRQIDAYKEGTVYVVNPGTTPFLSTK